MLKQKENYNFMKRKITKYDKTEVYKKEIAPIISDLKVACTFAGLPMFVTVAIKMTIKQEQHMKVILCKQVQDTKWLTHVLIQF